MVTPRYLAEHQCIGTGSGTFAKGVWGSSNYAYNRDHRIMTKGDWNTYWSGSGGYTEIGSAYSTNQCVPFGAFDTFYYVYPWSAGSIMNRTSRGSTSVNITHYGVVSVYVKSPLFELRNWRIENGAELQVMLWNGSTGSSFVGEPNCYVYYTSQVTLADLTNPKSNTYHTVDYNYSTGYARLFTLPFYDNIPSLTRNGTIYLSIVLDGSGYEDFNINSYGGAEMYFKNSIMDYTDFRGSNYYQIHNKVPVYCSNGNCGNVTVKIPMDYDLYLS